MNKYNVRAIRNELDGYIRTFSWKKFRARFQGLDVELQQAVVQHRPNQHHHKHKSSSKRHSSTLLHALCHCVHASPPVPIDLLESVIHACPHLLSGDPTVISTSKQSSSHPATPLSVALHRQASPNLIDCLLLHDTSRQSLYMADGKGDTPLLQAVKSNASDDIVMLLIEYDTTRRSLLIPSKKRHRVPLFYVAQQELAHVRLDEDNNNVDEELPAEVQLMLLQTHQALQIQKGTLNAPAAKTIRIIDDTEEDLYLSGISSYEDAYYSDDEHASLQEVSEEQHCTNLLHAALACAHLLGDKHSVSLVSFLLSRIPDLENAVDDKGNTILHHLCEAPHLFTESSLLNGRCLLETILERHEQAQTMPNRNGKIPLHLALETRKPWQGFLQELVVAAPESLYISTQPQGHLPLYSAIQHYTYRSKAIHHIWNAYPEASAIQDPTSRLYPFQLAASIRGREEQGSTSSTSSSSFPKTTTTGQEEAEGTSMHDSADPPLAISKIQNENDNDIDSQSSRQRKLATTTRQPTQEDLDQLSYIFFFLRSAPQVLREATDAAH